MGLLNDIKKQIASSGANKGKFLYFREGVKLRVRFLEDFEDGKAIVFHDSYEQGINYPCQEQLGKNCPCCDEELDVRTRTLYAWSVWDYDSKEVKILMFAVSSYTPIPALAAMYENYGTLLDRDYVISQSGKGTSKSFTVIPQDKQKFRNDRAKPFSERKFMELVDKAYPCEENGDDDDEDDAPVKKRPTKKPVSSKASNKAKRNAQRYDEDDEDEDDDFEEDEDEDVEDDDWEEEEDDEEEVDYSEMTAKELYKLCKERDIEVLQKKPERYYIKKLEADDAAHDDWDEEED